MPAQHPVADRVKRPSPNYARVHRQQIGHAIEHLSRDDWLDDCLADMLARGYAEAGKTRSNTLLLRG